MKAKNAFEASGNSPTYDGVESVWRRIVEAFEKIRQQDSPPTQEERFQRRVKVLTQAALSSPCVVKAKAPGHVIEIEVPTETAEELIEALGGANERTKEGTDAVPSRGCTIDARGQDAVAGRTIECCGRDASRVSGKILAARRGKKQS